MIAGEFKRPRFVVVDRIRLTPDEFQAMPIDARPDNLTAPPYTLRRVLIDGRWHACDRQYSFGLATHFARPIVVVVQAEVRP